jgi:aldose 1-epimerase
VRLYTLAHEHGLSARISDYGGVVHALWVPDRRGDLANVALGFPSLEAYVDNFARDDATYFGAIVGRYANRIAQGEFRLDDVAYALPRNNGPNTLHGGPGAYHVQVWAASTEQRPDAVSVTLTYSDPDGHNGFPGTVDNTVTYTLTSHDALRIDYAAVSDAPTVINLTNHTYFNLSGEGSGHVLDHRVQIEADTFTPVDENVVPTGEFAPVAGTPFDFRVPKAIGQEIHRGEEQLLFAHGYDHNYVLRGTGLRVAAKVSDPRSGRILTVHTTEPGIQFYSGNFLVGDLRGTGGRTYRQSDGFALETQHFPDSPHHIGEEGWPSVLLSPGETRRSTTVFEFGSARGD